jgi:hypothetical protein
MNDKIQSVKDHISRNKTVYISTGISVAIAGITCAIMRGRYTGVLRVLDQSDTINVRPLSFLSKQSNHIVNVIEREGRGHPGYLVKCLETGITYLSQTQAASDMGLSKSMLSSHLNGAVNDVNGFHFERVGYVYRD